MTTSDDLDCRIFIDADIQRAELAETIAHALSETTVEELGYNTILRTYYCEIEVRENEYFDEVSRKEFPGGFLAFRYSLEIYAVTGQPREKKIAQVAQLLKHLWSRGFPAVAACDYEDELPNKGGISVPWGNVLR